MLCIYLRSTIKFKQRISESHSYQDQIPMSYQFNAKNPRQIIFIGKLTENRSSSTSVGILKINRIYQIHYNHYHIGNDEYPLHNRLIFRILFIMKRKKNQQNIKGISIKNSRRIKNQTSAKHFPKMRESQIGKIIMIHPNKQQPTQAKAHVY